MYADGRSQIVVMEAFDDVRPMKGAIVDEKYSTGRQDVWHEICGRDALISLDVKKERRWKRR